MTEPVRPANPSLREIPVPAGSDVDLRLGSNRLNIRTGRDGVVVVRARGGEDLDRELEVITGHGYLKVIDGGAGTFRLGPLSLRTHPGVRDQSDFGRRLPGQPGEGRPQRPR